nr:unnamed protein product [Digitaria exilis]
MSSTSSLSFFTNSAALACSSRPRSLFSGVSWMVSMSSSLSLGNGTSMYLCFTFTSFVHLAATAAFVVSCSAIVLR